jgi:hypothetical protein
MYISIKIGNGFLWRGGGPASTRLADNLANFYADFQSVGNVAKKSYEKIKRQKGGQKIKSLYCYFDFQSCWLITFVGLNFLQLFNGFEISLKL